MIKLFLSLLTFAACLAIPTLRAADADLLAGKWHIVFNTEGGDRESNALFEQNGEKVTGKWDIDGAKAGGTPLAGTLVDKDLTLEFPIESPEAGPGTLKLKAKLADDGTMSGDWAFQDYSGTFKGSRLKTSAAN